MARLLLEMRDVHMGYTTRKSLLRSDYHPVINGVSLEIREGQRLGVMGHNGAGKSTLLRLIAGIYAPDSGKVINHGARVSLLSLQAGFDPRLNGWDNALLSGVLMGMTPAQARQRLKSIHDFCELGDQMNDLLGTYSSGMRARLGFAVALTMEADLLLIDEVLSVGDQSFQEKSEKAVMNAVDQGCAMILVSHSPFKLQKWTDSIVSFEGGNIHPMSLDSLEGGA
ncbi:ABC transporter ATP-binding protein [Pseudomonas sp. PDM16]|uniref:ABC transporter ATP-binding protein n=1 Tax=Pseudomonas sp. PDM16 TaxID=2769292 RepID=UPI001780A970|nr:ABC transporter ATP-binding protein [Pseudomonas sp. PDM16]MBD9414003.1 ABC transporter ATP-binding protein [Pseudomonas sp. PDM16]